MVEDQAINHQDIEMHPHLQAVEAEVAEVVMLNMQLQMLLLDPHQLQHQIDKIVLDNKLQLKKLLK